MTIIFTVSTMDAGITVETAGVLKFGQKPTKKKRRKNFAALVGLNTE